MPLHQRGPARQLSAVRPSRRAMVPHTSRARLHLFVPREAYDKRSRERRSPSEFPQWMGVMKALIIIVTVVCFDIGAMLAEALS